MQSFFVITSAAQFPVDWRTHHRCFKNGTSLTSICKWKMVLAFKHFIVSKDLRNGLVSSGFSWFDIAFDLLRFFLHQADKLWVEFSVCFVFEETWVIVNTSEQFRFLQFLFDCFDLLYFLIGNLLSYGLFGLFRKFRQIFFITWVFFLRNSKLIVIISWVSIAMLVEKILRIPCYVFNICLF